MLTSKASSSAPSILTQLSNPVTETFVYSAFVPIVEPTRLCRPDIVSASIRNTGPGTLQLSSENFSTVLVSAGESVDVELDPTETLDGRCDDDHCLVFVNARRRVGGKFSYIYRDVVSVVAANDPEVRFALPDGYVVAGGDVNKIDVFNGSTFTYTPPGGIQELAYDYTARGANWIAFGSNGVVRIDGADQSETVLDAGTGTVQRILVNDSAVAPRILYYDDNDDLWIIEPDGTAVANHNIASFDFGTFSNYPGRNYCLGYVNGTDDIVIIDLQTGGINTISLPAGTTPETPVQIGDVAYYPGPEKNVYQSVDLSSTTVSELQLPFSGFLGVGFDTGALYNDLVITPDNLNPYFFPSTGDTLFTALGSNLGTVANLALTTTLVGGSVRSIRNRFDTRRPIAAFSANFEKAELRRYSPESDKALFVVTAGGDESFLATFKEVYNPTP